MLKVALPRPSTDAVSRDAVRSPWQRGLDDDAGGRPWKQLSRAEAEAIRQSQPPLSPWRVVAAQVAVGLVASCVAAVVFGRLGALSALYGAAAVAVPGALLARGATSPLTSLSPVVSAVSMLVWAFVKMMAAVFMLAIAPRIVPGLNWPVMLVTMVVCMQTYAFALLWRGRSK